MSRRVYLTTTLAYVNADPHIGFAAELIRADVYARYRRLLGDEVFFNTGTDEHGSKIYHKALEAGESPQVYVDRYAAKFKDLVQVLNLSEVNFIRTTDPHHQEAVLEFWRRALANDFIEKKTYRTKYCVGCELAKTDSELVAGHCPDHPTSEIEFLEEENYFFKFSKFQTYLADLYKDQPNFVIPATRLREVKSFVAGVLQDFSISRLKSKMPWGIPVPGDSEQVIYVWFDALVNYLSVLGWPKDQASFEAWWPVIQFCGKDNLRQQSAMWQAMLSAVGLPPSKHIIVNGFITSAGQKMSKSLGNVVDPTVLVADWGVDVLRYFILRELVPFEDGDFTLERFKTAYNSELANGLGNLTSRIIKMAETYEVKIKPADLRPAGDWLPDDFFAEYREAVEAFEPNRALDFIWTQIKEADLYIQNTTPFKLIKTNPAKAYEHVEYLLGALWRIAVGLEPFLPETALKIQAMIKGELPLEPLFLRRD
ncbi:MAG: methionine--tRNA ligase [Patescibacteria group bacterium]